jgi:hypothetical protein
VVELLILERNDEGDKGRKELRGKIGGNVENLGKIDKNVKNLGKIVIFVDKIVGNDKITRNFGKNVGKIENSDKIFGKIVKSRVFSYKN